MGDHHENQTHLQSVDGSDTRFPDRNARQGTVFAYQGFPNNPGALVIKVKSNDDSKHFWVVRLTTVEAHDD